MRIYSSLLLLFLLLLILVSCKHTEKLEKAGTASGTQVASNEARIIATLVSIDEARDTEGACSKEPCRGKIIIESVMKIGSLYQLSDTQEPISVSFAFTLAPTTDDLFPGIKTHYPGLKINDKFEATIQSRPAKNEAGFAYIIYDYKKLSSNSTKNYHLEK